MRKLLGICIAFTMLLAGYAQAQTPPNVNVQGIWWNDPDESEPGWGLNLAHQGDILFASWFTYDTDGTSMWLYMSSAQKTGTNRYEGDIYRSTGSPYNDYSAASFDQAIVGRGTLTFSDATRTAGIRFPFKTDLRRGRMVTRYENPGLAATRRAHGRRKHRQARHAR